MELSSELKSYIKKYQEEIENNLFDRFAVYLFRKACELCLNEFGENLNL